MRGERSLTSCGNVASTLIAAISDSLCFLRPCCDLSFDSAKIGLEVNGSPMFTGEGLGASRDNLSANLARVKSLRQGMVSQRRAMLDMETWLEGEKDNLPRRNDVDLFFWPTWSLIPLEPSR